MISKIKVASLTNGMGIGGTAREIVSLNKRLNKNFFDHFVISLGSKEDVRAKSIDENKIFFLSDPKEVAAVLKENEISVVYAHRHGRNEPAHDAIAKEIDDKISLLEMNTFSVLDKGYFGQRCDKHVFVSKTNLLKYCAQNNIQFDFKKHKTIYGLIDCEGWQNNMPSELEIKEYKTKLGLEGSFVIGRMARPVMEKWDDEMLVMWRRLSKINPKVKFLICGVPEKRKKLLLAAGTSENLVILDPTSSDKELALFYSAIDVFVHDSQIGECWCSTIEESMIFRKPVVVKTTPFPKHLFGRVHTKDNGQIEQVKNNENGFVVKSGAAMAVAVDYLSNHPEEVARMGEKNYKQVTGKSDAKIGIKTFEKVFIESMLDKNADLSPQILEYYNSNDFFPDENSIKSWFEEYYRRLKDVYGKKYHDSILEKIWLNYLTYKRKLETLLRIMQ